MKSKILVADDSITIQKIVAMAFEHEDTIVEGIGDGEEAFNKLDDFRPDIVLADVEMPGYNGFELSQKIKQSHDFNSTRVLLLASDFEEFDEDQFRMCQADDHIAKPFKSDDIINKVRELLSVDYKKKETESPPEPQFSDVLDEEMNEDEVFSLPIGNLLDETEDFSDLAPDGPANDSFDDEEEEFFTLPDTALIEEPVVWASEEPPANTGQEVTGESADEVFELSPTDIVESPEDPSGQENEQQEKSLDELLDSLEEISQDKAFAEDFPEGSSTTESQPSIDEVSETLSEMLENVKDLRELAASREETMDQDSTGTLDETADSDVAAEPEIVQEVTSVVQNKSNGIEATHSEEIPVETYSADPVDTKSDSIVAEPEDLLQQIMPSSTLISLQKRARPESIQESLTYLSRLSKKEKQPMKAAVKESIVAVEEASVLNPVDMGQQIENQVRLYLNDSLGALIESEFSELSDKIQLSVREVVRDVAPGIVRDVIQAEIEKMKNQE
jgi:CheY-like chemotaxis protein